MFVNISWQLSEIPRWDLNECEFENFPLRLDRCFLCCLFVDLHEWEKGDVFILTLTIPAPVVFNIGSLSSPPSPLLCNISRIIPSLVAVGNEKHAKNIRKQEQMAWKSGKNSHSLVDLSLTFCVDCCKCMNGCDVNAELCRCRRNFKINQRNYWRHVGNGVALKLNPKINIKLTNTPAITRDKKSRNKFFNEKSIELMAMTTYWPIKSSYHDGLWFSFHTFCVRRKFMVAVVLLASTFLSPENDFRLKFNKICFSFPSSGLGRPQ